MTEAAITAKEIKKVLRHKFPGGERTPAYRGGSFLLQREQHH